MSNICVLRRANVIAETHCDMYVLTADSFQQILRNFPSAGQNIRENLEKKMKSQKDGHVDELHNMMKRSLNKVKNKVKMGGLLKSRRKSNSVNDMAKKLGQQVTMSDLDQLFGSGGKTAKVMPSSKISTETSPDRLSSSNHRFHQINQNPRKTADGMEHLIGKLERHIDHKFWQLSTALRIPTRHFNDYGK